MQRLLKRTLRSAATSIMHVVRQESPEFLYWPVYYPFNFGDWIGPFLYQHLVGQPPEHRRPSDLGRDTTYLAVGSILGAACMDSIVWGSGLMDQRTLFPRPRRIDAVRGPLTREVVLALGYECPEVYGDPGLLLPLFVEPAKDRKESLVGVVPHFRDLEGATERFAGREADGIRLIDVRRPIDEIVEAITGCEAVVSSSLHGLIVAHAYGVPTGHVDLGQNLMGDGMKFADHYAALGLPAPPELSRGLERSVDELASFARDQPVPDPGTVVEPLLDTCPFPCDPDRLAGARNRISQRFGGHALREQPSRGGVG